MPEKPPVFTLISELLAWTLDRTADFPKSHRFTIGQRIDNFTLDALERCLEASYAPAASKREPLTKLNMLLEKLRVFWRIVHQHGWISQQQLFFVIRKVDEIGRMAEDAALSAAHASRRDFKPWTTLVIPSSQRPPRLFPGGCRHYSPACPFSPGRRHPG